MHRFVVKLNNESEPHYFGTFKVAQYFVEQNRSNVEDFFTQEQVNIAGVWVWKPSVSYREFVTEDKNSTQS